MSEFRLNGIPVNSFTDYQRTMVGFMKEKVTETGVESAWVFISHVSGRGFRVAYDYTSQAIIESENAKDMRRNYNHLKKYANQYYTCM